MHISRSPFTWWKWEVFGFVWCIICLGTGSWVVGYHGGMFYINFEYCKKTKTVKIRVFIAQRYGPLLGRVWTILAEILGDGRRRSWLHVIRISWGCVDVCRIGGWKTARKKQKKWSKIQFFQKVQSRYEGTWAQTQVSQVPQTLTHSGKLSKSTVHSVGGEQPLCLAVRSRSSARSLARYSEYYSKLI